MLEDVAGGVDVSCWTVAATSVWYKMATGMEMAGEDVIRKKKTGAYGGRLECGETNVTCWTTAAAAAPTQRKMAGSGHGRGAKEKAAIEVGHEVIWATAAWGGRWILNA